MIKRYLKPSVFFCVTNNFLIGRIFLIEGIRAFLLLKSVSWIAVNQNEERNGVSGSLRKYM